MPVTKISRSTFIIFVISAVFLISMPASAFEMGKRGPGGKGGFFNNLSILDLSNEQEEAIEEIREQTAYSLKPLRDEIGELELLNAILAENINIEEVNQKIEKINDIRSSIGTIMMNSRLETAKILTAEQRLALLTFIEQKKKIRRTRGEKRGVQKNRF